MRADTSWGTSQLLPPTIPTHLCPRKHCSGSAQQILNLILNETTIFYLNSLCFKQQPGSCFCCFALATLENDTILLTILPWQHEDSSSGRLSVWFHNTLQTGGIRFQTNPLYLNYIKHQQYLDMKLKVYSSSVSIIVIIPSKQAVALQIKWTV